MTTTGSKFNDGSTWALATDFQQALSATAVCSELWVAKGVYKPTTNTDPSIYFYVASGIAVYGGFAGTETLREQRDPTTNLTVLSGDIDNNDSVDAFGRDVDATHIAGSNSWHVVLMVGGGSDTVLDGFTITGGDARSVSAYGAGLYCPQCNPSLSQLVFIGNAADRGGAMFIDGDGGTASPTIGHVTFEGNQASRGGALYILAGSGTSNPSISDATFSDNSAASGDGGAVTIDGESSSTSLTRVAFVGNSAEFGGAISCNAGGSTGTCSVTLTNATFLGNHASGTGGALFTDFTGAGARQIHLNFVTFNDNQSDSGGGGAIAFGSFTALYLSNSIVWGNRAPLGTAPEIYLTDSNAATTDHSIVRGSGGSASWNSAFGSDGGGNLDVDPVLVPGYQLGAPQTISPGTGSPAIDAADDTNCPADDQRGVARKQGAHCDIGAVETFPVDLITHKSMDACWTGAQTESGFLDLVRSQIDGVVTCAAPIATASYSACNTAACPGGATGCPLTTRAGAFAGSFADGSFNATGSVDNTTINVQFTVPFSKTCAYDVSNVTATFAPSYIFIDDGNFGDYAALLNRFTLTLPGYTVSSTDPVCQSFAGTVGPVIISDAQTALQTSLAQNLREATVEKAVCPLVP